MSFIFMIDTTAGFSLITKYWDVSEERESGVDSFQLVPITVKEVNHLVPLKWDACNKLMERDVEIPAPA